MKHYNPEKVNQQVQRALHGIARDRKRLEEGQVPDTALGLTYTGLGDYTRQMALYSILLDDANESKKWILESCEYFLKSIPEYRRTGLGEEVPIDLRAMEMAVLSRDAKLREKTAQICLGIAQKHEEYTKKKRAHASWFFQTMCLANVATGYYAEAERYVTEGQKWEKIYKGLLSGCQGVIKKDADLFKSGLDKVLEYHERNRKDSYLGLITAWGDVCVAGAVLCALAKDRGMNAWKEIDSPYVPKILFED